MIKLSSLLPLTARMKVFDKMKWSKQEKMKKFRAFGKLQKFSKDFDKGGRR